MIKKVEQGQKLKLKIKNVISGIEFILFDKATPDITVPVTKMNAKRSRRKQNHL